MQYEKTNNDPTIECLSIIILKIFLVKNLIKYVYRADTTP